MTYDALGCAYYLVDYAYRQNEESFLSGLKIVKYLFIAQGTHLSLYNKPLFKDDIIYLENGIRVKEVDTHFLKYGNWTIPRSYKELNPNVWEGLIKFHQCRKNYVDESLQKNNKGMFADAYYKNDDLSYEAKEVLEAVFDNFKNWSNTSLLENVIYKSQAYQIAKAWNQPVSLDDLKKEYKEKVNFKEEC